MEATAMREMPLAIEEIIHEEVSRHPNDIATGVDCAIRRIRALPDYEEHLDLFVQYAVHDMFYDCRHSVNAAIKGTIGRPSQVGTTNGDRVSEAYRSYYDTYIGSTTWRKATGEELEFIRDSEKAKSLGSLFNSEVAGWLVDQGVTGKKRAEQVVKEKTFSAAYRRIYLKVMGCEPGRSPGTVTTSGAAPQSPNGQVDGEMPFATDHAGAKPGRKRTAR
jgi:hypothetical protein